MIRNIFWTGGFDSTFRLLQSINDENVSEINLYYLSLVIDNVKKSNTRRTSFKQEINTMNQILKVVDINKIKSFNIIGEKEDLLYYTFIFQFPFMNYTVRDTIEYSDENKVYYFDLLINDIISRPVNQWGAITQILDDLDIEAEICLEKKSVIWNNIKEYVVDNQIKFELFPPLKAFRRYQMPLFNVDRDEMMNISNENDWLEILKISWSCWYPNDNKPCGKCFTCVKRPL